MSKNRINSPQIGKQIAQKGLNDTQKVIAVKINQNLCKDTLKILSKNQIKLASSHQLQKRAEYLEVMEKAEQFGDFIDNKITNLVEGTRKEITTYLQYYNLFQSNSCLMCIGFLAKNELENYIRQNNYQTPVFLMTYERFLTEEIQNHISALANEGSGTIFIVGSHLNNVIKQGFQKIKPYMLQLIEEKIKFCLNQILNNNIINIKVDFVKLFQDFQSLGLKYQAKNQFVIRIKVSINQDEIKQNFCVKFMKTKYILRHKMFKAKLIQLTNQIYWDLFEIQSSYQQIIAHAKRKISNLKTYHNCKQNNNFQLFQIIGQNKIKFQCPPKKKIQIEITKQTFPFNFLLNVCQSIQDYCLQNYFQQTNPGQSILLFLENEKQQKNYLFTPLSELLTKMKCKYQVIEPMVQLQNQIERVMKINYPQYCAYHIKYFIYNSDFRKLQANLPELFEKYHNLRYKLNIRNICQKIRVKAVLRQRQVEKLIQIVKKNFNIQLDVRKGFHCYQNCNQKYYKDVQFLFQKHQMHIAACVYCLLYLANKSPVT